MRTLETIARTSTGIGRRYSVHWDGRRTPGAPGCNPPRSGGNTRLYSRADIERLELIGQLTDEGINLAGVVRILDMKSQMQERDEEVERLRAEVKALREQVHEYRMRETITALMPYEGKDTSKNPLAGLLRGTPVDEEKDG